MSDPFDDVSAEVIASLQADVAPVEEQKVETVTATPAADAKVEPKVETKETAQTEQQRRTPEHVPYDRFQQTVRERNELRARIATLEAAQKTAPAKQEEDPLDQIVSDLLGENKGKKDPPAGKPSQIEQQLQELTQWRQEQELAHHVTSLEAEIDDVVASNPDVPKALIVQAIAENPNLTAEQVAKSYQSWANEVGTKAVERYKATLPQGGQVTTPVQQAAQKPSAMPRPTGDNPAPQSRRVREPSWDDVSKDVRSALTGQ